METRPRRRLQITVEYRSLHSFSWQRRSDLGHVFCDCDLRHFGHVISVVSRRASLWPSLRLRHHGHSRRVSFGQIIQKSKRCPVEEDCLANCHALPWHHDGCWYFPQLFRLGRPLVRRHSLPVSPSTPDNVDLRFLAFALLGVLLRIPETSLHSTSPNQPNPSPSAGPGLVQEQ